MISNTNNKSDTFAHLYGVLLYKKKDIIAIQEKLGISWKASMANDNVLKRTEHEPDEKTLADSYKLLLHLVGDLIPIQEISTLMATPFWQWNIIMWQIETLEVLLIYQFRNYLICFYAWKRI